MKLSYETKTAIRTALERQSTAYAAAKQAQCTESQVQSLARHEGLELTRPWEKWQDDLILNKASNGLSWSQIAERTGKSQRQCINRGGTFNRRVPDSGNSILANDAVAAREKRYATKTLHDRTEALIASMARRRNEPIDDIKWLLFDRGLNRT